MQCCQRCVDALPARPVAAQLAAAVYILPATVQQKAAQAEHPNAGSTTVSGRTVPQAQVRWPTAWGGGAQGGSRKQAGPLQGASSSQAPSRPIHVSIHPSGLGALVSIIAPHTKQTPLLGVAEHRLCCMNRRCAAHHQTVNRRSQGMFPTS